MENLLTNTEYSSDPYNRLTDSRDKVSNFNLLKTISSQEEPTSNHISLLQAKNEIRNPKNSINMSIKNKKNYFSPDKTYKIMLPKKILTEKKSQKNIYEERNNNNENLLPYAYHNFINNKKYNKAFSSINSPFRKNELKQNNNNIYFYRNENENNAYKKYVNKPQYNYNMHYKEPIHYKNNSVKVNPLYERMRRNKMRNYNNYYSPFSRKIIQDNNKIKVVYNRVNEINSTENDDYNDISKYGNETVENNYYDRNMFY